MRPAELFVRSLSHQEAVKLKRMSTRAEHQSTRIRAAILLASNVKTPMPQIARMWLTDESHVRNVIPERNNFASRRASRWAADSSPTGTISGQRARRPAPGRMGGATAGARSYRVALRPGLDRTTARGHLVVAAVRRAPWERTRSRRHGRGRVA
jgi:hypothetical protein